MYRSARRSPSARGGSGAKSTSGISPPSASGLRGFGDVRRRVAFRLVAAVIFLRVGPLDLRVRDDAVAAEAADVLERVPALVGVLLEERLHARQQALDDVRPDRMIEHRRRAHLSGAA